MEMKIPVIAITAVVVVIVLAGVLMPVLDDATAKTDKFTNDGYFDMTYDEREEVTVKWEYATPYQLTVNDEVVPIDASNFSSSARRTIFMGDDFVLRTNSQWSGGVPYPLVQFNASTGSSIFAGAVPGSENNMTIVCSNGTYTVYLGSTTSKTGSYTYIYTVSNDGEYVMKYSDGTAYVLGDSEFIAMGTSSISGQDLYVKITGTVEDGAEITTWKDTGDWVFTNESINATPVNGYVDLYELTSITADVADDDSHSGSITYNYFLVPASVDAERSVHFTDNQKAIFAAIPIMVIVALLIAVVALVFRGRDF